MKKKLIIGLVVAASVITVSPIIGLAVTGATIGWGPFSFMYWPKEVKRVLKENPYDDYQKGIVFYGASNFRLWKEMKEDLQPYNVANCGFGGSTDKMLMEKADKLLYPYNPELVFLQTGSNDYPGMTGSYEEIAKEVFDTKKEMYSEFHSKMPETKFFVMAGILMPGRSEYTPIVTKVNEYLRDYCATTDYVTFLDSESLTYKDGEYITEYFIKDGIHLTHEARLIWANDYILPAIKTAYGE